jgi:O-antigen/teichoic acid export membrane protein
MTASQLLSSAAWNTAAKILQLVLQLVTLALIGRYAGAQAFGAFALCWVVVGLFEQVFVTALSDSLIQQPAAEQGHFDSMLVVLMTSGVVFALSVLWFVHSLRPVPWRKPNWREPVNSNARQLWTWPLILFRRCWALAWPPPTMAFGVCSGWKP